MKADEPLRILFVEDLPTDAELAERELRKAGFSFTSLRVETKEAFLKALEEFRPDLIISDYAMPEFDGMQALKLSLTHDPHLPFILFTGSMNEETAVACMKAGASDYIIKEHIKRLPLAVTGTLEQQRARLMKKETERDLQESEKRYRNLFDNANEAIFVAQDGRLVFLNPMSAIITGYSGEELRAKPFIEFIHPDDREMVMDRHFKRMQGEEIPHRYPFRLIHKNGNIRWEELNSVMISWKGKPASLNFMNDITERKQTEEKLQETLESLRKSFAATIQIMVSVVESRDPYTSGHQIRSANLARAIATEMELPQDVIEGLRMAGSIHDIGKLSIPAEILSKPTKLTNLEFSLIKEHAQRGYEMLKDVESPWPLAQIVYQHHERMDGSGYPRNLKGEEICMEARILAVADVVEAMASHRPYRPGLGLDAALNEIEKNRGIFYDKTVADACLRLFREKGFKFEGT